MMNLLKLELKLAMRDKMSFILGIGLPVVLFFLITSMMTDSYSELVASRVQREFLMSMSIYSSLSFALFAFPLLFQNDRVNRWYLSIKHSPISMWKYYMAKFVRILINFVIAIFVVFTVGFVFKEIEMSLIQWIISGMLISLGCICLLPLGFLIGLISSAEKISAVSNILYIVLGMIGGLWWPVDLFPKFLQSIANLTPTHHIRNLVVNYLNSGDISGYSLVILFIYGIICSMIMAFIVKRKESI